MINSVNYLDISEKINPRAFHNIWKVQAGHYFLEKDRI